MIKRSFERMLVCILIFILLFDFLLTSVSYADPPANETENTVVVTDQVEENEAKHNERLEENNSGLAGILLMLIRLSMYIPAMIVNLETYAVAISAGKADTDPLSVFITPFDIIFNRFRLTDINIFSIDGLDPGCMVVTMRESIAMWFSVMTGIAIGFLIVIFLVIILRLSLQDDVAERKAKMKSSLVDWGVSVLLVICMDVLVVGLVSINSMFVEAIKGAASQDISAAVTAIQDVILSTNTGLLLGFGALFTYFALTISTILFLIKYIFRFFKVVLLVVIAPLAPIPYALNRMTDKKSGSSLQIWLFELIDAVFTQIIHCIIYVCIVGAALQGFAANTEIKGLEALAPCTFAIFAMFFIIPAENLVRRIFGIKRSGGLTTIVRDVAGGAREVSSAVAAIKEISSGTSIIGGIMNGNNNTYNNGAGVPGMEEGNVHTKPIGTGENPILMDGSGIDPVTGKPYDPSYINGVEGGDAALVNSILPGADPSALPQGEGVGEDGVPMTADGVPLALGPGKDEASEKLDGLAALVTGLNETHDETHDETYEEIHTETYEEIPAEEGDTPVVVPPDGTEIDEKQLEFINDKLAEIHEDLKQQIEEVFDTEKLKEIETQIVELLKAKLEGIDNPTSEEIMQAISEVHAQISEQVKTGDAIQDEKMLNAIGDFTKVVGIALAGGCDVEVEKKVDAVVDADAGVIVPADTMEGVGAEVAGHIRQAVSNEIALLPASRDLAVDIATKYAIITGKIDVEKTDLAETITNIAVNSTQNSVNNNEEALIRAQEQIEKEGKAALARLDNFRTNPSPETFAQLKEAEKIAAEIEVKAAANQFAITATKNMSARENVTGTSSTGVTHTPNTEVTTVVIDALNAQKNGGNNNT